MGRTAGELDAFDVEYDVPAPLRRSGPVRSGPVTVLVEAALDFWRVDQFAEADIR